MRLLMFLSWIFCQVLCSELLGLKSPSLCQWDNFVGDLMFTIWGSAWDFVFECDVCFWYQNGVYKLKVATVEEQWVEKNTEKQGQARR